MEQDHLNPQDDFSQTVFNAIPIPVMVVDDDVRIIKSNRSAEKLVAHHQGPVLYHRCGDVLHCLHSYDSPEGCGRGPFCDDCIIRGSVKEALTQKKLTQCKGHVELRLPEKTVKMEIRISASPFNYKNKELIILTIEDLTELTILKNLIPICVQCKKIRNDQNFWIQVDHYFTTYMKGEVTHGICPDCAKFLYPELNTTKDKKEIK